VKKSELLDILVSAGALEAFGTFAVILTPFLSSARSVTYQHHWHPAKLVPPVLHIHTARKSSFHTLRKQICVKLALGCKILRHPFAKA
jgi:hypothetical protein